MQHYLLAAGTSALMLFWLVSSTLLPAMQGLAHLQLQSLVQ